MTVERQPEIVDLIEAHQKYHPDTKVIVEGDIFLINVYERNWLGVVASELLGNCLEKEGVATVKITIEDGRLVVEDDVVHDDTEKIVLKLNAKKVKTTKEGHYGVGIWGSRKLLGDHDGKLEYHAEGGRIVAVATWVE